MMVEPYAMLRPWSVWHKPVWILQKDVGIESYFRLLVQAPMNFVANQWARVPRRHRGDKHSSFRASSLFPPLGWALFSACRWFLPFCRHNPTPVVSDTLPDVFQYRSSRFCDSEPIPFLHLICITVLCACAFFSYMLYFSYDNKYAD